MTGHTTRQVLHMIEANGGPDRLDLSGSDLSGVDLSKQAIQEVREQLLESDPRAEPCWLSPLGGITLKHACLQEARLDGADLQSAQLDGADLRGASLVGANLREASLWGSNLEGSNLAGAVLEHAYLGIANLENAYLRGADLTGAKGAGAYLLGAVLTDASLREANLKGAVLWAADLRGADLRSATLTRANLTKADLTGAEFTWRTFTSVSKVSDVTLPDGTRIGTDKALEEFLDWCLANVPVSEQANGQGKQESQLAEQFDDKPKETHGSLDDLSKEMTRRHHKPEPMQVEVPPDTASEGAEQDEAMGLGDALGWYFSPYLTTLITAPMGLALGALGILCTIGVLARAITLIAHYPGWFFLGAPGIPLAGIHLAALYGATVGIPRIWRRDHWGAGKRVLIIFGTFTGSVLFAFFIEQIEVAIFRALIGEPWLTW